LEPDGLCVGEDEVRLEEKGVQRFESDMKRPEMPRRRDRICSFQVTVLRSIVGMMDCVTSSRTKVRRAVTSESKR